MSTTNLTPAQHAILAYAHQHAAGRIAWFPDHIKGGARAKVLEGLRARDLIEQAGTDLAVSAGGYAALGVEAPTPQVAQAAEPAEPAEAAEPAEVAEAPAPRRNSMPTCRVKPAASRRAISVFSSCSTAGYSSRI